MKRQRQPNFTTQERDILMNLVTKFKHVIENKQTDGVTTQEKNLAWNNITKQFNTISPNHVPRTEESLKVYYKNLKKDLRKKSANNRKETYLTGGGPEPPKLSDDDYKIISIINGKTVFGLNNEFDNDVLEDIPIMAHANESSVNDESEEEMEKSDWKHHKALDLKKKPNMALKKETIVPKNLNNIEVIFEDNVDTPNLIKSSKETPLPNNIEVAMLKDNLAIQLSSKKTKEISLTAILKNDNLASTPNNGRSISRRRPCTTVKTLTSSRLGEKYEILVDKKIELAKCLQKEHEARMMVLELDIKLKQKQLNSY